MVTASEAVVTHELSFKMQNLLATSCSCVHVRPSKGDPRIGLDHEAYFRHRRRQFQIRGATNSEQLTASCAKLLQQHTAPARPLNTDCSIQGIKNAALASPRIFALHTAVYLGSMKPGPSMQHDPS
ncbi:hypothetical protein ABBQ32_011207 [Trebouxia sp. C0010 RCD-2024]